MNSPTHIIDPDGEVIIILRNANSQFAQLAESPSTWFTDDAQDLFKKSGKSTKRKKKARRCTPATEEPAIDGKFDELTVDNGLCIQMSAKHLISASPVFKKILTGGWKESVTYFQKGLVEITAESWDIEAFMILFRAIHGQFYHIPRKLTLEMLAKVAVIADYYDCKEVLYFPKDVWINNLEEDIPTAVFRDSILWVWIAWFFQLPCQFELSTSNAISKSDGWVDHLGLPIPDNIIGSMNECREKAINNLIVLLHGTRDAFLNHIRGCCFECRSIMHGALSMQMQASHLLLPDPEAPFLNLNHKSLVQRVLSFESPEWYGPSLSCSSNGPNYPHHCSNSCFTSIFEELKVPLEGLKLDQFAGSQSWISAEPSE